MSSQFWSMNYAVTSELLPFLCQALGFVLVFCSILFLHGAVTECQIGNLLKRPLDVAGLFTYRLKKFHWFGCHVCSPVIQESHARSCYTTVGANTFPEQNKRRNTMDRWPSALLRACLCFRKCSYIHKMYTWYILYIGDRRCTILNMISGKFVEWNVHTFPWFSAHRHPVWEWPDWYSLNIGTTSGQHCRGHHNCPQIEVSRVVSR